MSGKPTIPRTCEQCGDVFLAYAGNVRKGYGLYCSSSCYGESKKGPIRPAAERFWEKIDKDGPLPEFYPELGPCWLWTAGKNEQGYGIFNPDGHMVLAHRYAYEMANGLIPNGLDGCHYCDRPSCVNPLHIWPGTRRENVDDMIEKGRYSTHPNVLRGEDSPDAKLTDDAVRDIRFRYAAGGISQRALAAEHGVSQGLIRGITQRTAWAHVE